MSLVISMVSLVPLVTAHIHPHARSAKKSGTAEDIQSHLELELESFNFDSIKNMTEEERDYHYFRLHDFDKNDLLDGLEVLKAMSHTHAKDNKDDPDQLEESSFDDMVVMIDKVNEYNIEYVKYITYNIKNTYITAVLCIVRF